MGRKPGERAVSLICNHDGRPENPAARPGRKGLITWPMQPEDESVTANGRTRVFEALPVTVQLA